MRFAEAATAFLPVSLVLFLLLLLGRVHLFPWVTHPTPLRGDWLTTWWAFPRDFLSLTALYLVTLAYVYYDLRPDVAPLKDRVTGWRRGLYAWIAGDYRGTPEELKKVERRLNVLAGLVVVLYGYLFSIIAFDLVMSLAPYWYSTIFGWYFFMGAFLTGLTATGLMMVFWRQKLGLHAIIRREQFHDMGKLVFGFTIFWTYLMFSQFLVQWYGNLRIETAYEFFRMAGAWRPVALAGGHGRRRRGGGRSALLCGRGSPCSRPFADPPPRYTPPPFITNRTCSSAVMSCSGSPGTAITSAKYPAFRPKV